MKSLINQAINTVESITNRLDKTNERISEIVGKSEELLHSHNKEETK
jgi:DNA-binding protein